MNGTEPVSDKPVVTKPFSFKTYLPFLFALTAAFALFPVYFERQFPSLSFDIEPWRSLDPSWVVSLNKFNIDELIWGKDIIFTYGPFSYLSTRIGWGVSRYHLVLFDLFICFNLFSIFYSAVKGAEKKLPVILFITCFVLFLPISFGSATSLLLLSFLIFWLRESLNEPTAFKRTMQILVVCIAFYMKFNTGLIGLVLYLSELLFYYFQTRKNFGVIVLWSIVCLFVLYGLSFALHVYIPGYLAGGLNIIAGYNDLLYSDQSFQTELICAIVIICIVLLLIGINIFQNKKNKQQEIFISLFTLLSVYILYKQAFVRSDMAHVLDFYRYILLFILVGPLSTFNSRNVFSWLCLVSVVLIIFFNTTQQPHYQTFKNRFIKTDYFTGLINFTGQPNLNLLAEKTKLPQAILQKIGSSSIDVYPWNTHLLLVNRLNYTPRPAIHAYTAYTKYLEEMNFEFYNSTKAPQFILYTFDAIDNRYPLFDEPKLNISIMKNYFSRDTLKLGSKFAILFERKTGARPIKFTAIKQYELDLNDTIKPKENILYEIELKNSLSGKLFSVLSHGPEFSIKIHTLDKTVHQYRSSIHLLESGIFSTNYFGSTEDLYGYLNTGTANESRKITGYTFSAERINFFKCKIKVVELEYK